MFKERPRNVDKGSSEKEKYKNKRRQEFSEALERAKKVPLKEALKQYQKPKWNIKSFFKWPEAEIEFEELPEELQQNVIGCRNVTLISIVAGILVLVFVHSIGVMLTCLGFGLIFWIVSKYRERLFCSDRVIYIDGTVERENDNFFTKGKSVYIVDEEDNEKYHFVVQNRSRFISSKNDHYVKGDVVRLYLDKKVLPRIMDGLIPDYFTVTIIKNSPLLIEHEEDEEKQ